MHNWYTKIYPKGRQFVLALIDNGHYQIAQWDPPLKKWFVFGDNELAAVVAWHPLPEPPKDIYNRVDPVTYALETDPRFSDED